MFKLQVFANIGISEQFDEEREYTSLANLLSDLNRWLADASGLIEEAFAILEQTWLDAGNSFEARQDYASSVDMYPEDAGRGNIRISVYASDDDGDDNEPSFELWITCSDAYKIGSVHSGDYETGSLDTDDYALVESFAEKWENQSIHFNRSEPYITGLERLAPSSTVPTRLDFFRFKNNFSEYAADCSRDSSIDSFEKLLLGLQNQDDKHKLIEPEPFLAIKLSTGYIDHISNIDIIAFNSKFFSGPWFFSAESSKKFIAFILSAGDSWTTLLNIWSLEALEFIWAEHLKGHVYPTILSDRDRDRFVGHFYDKVERVDKFFFIQCQNRDISLEIVEAFERQEPPPDIARSSDSNLSDGHGFFLDKDSGVAYWERKDVGCCFMSAVPL